MSKYDYKNLQNGSDIRGVAVDGVEGESITLCSEAACRFGKAFLFWLANKTEKETSELTISVGRDPRISGPALASAFMEAIRPYGCRILDAGICSTPAMFMSTVFDEYKADGAVMITASHLPYNRNGFKFFDRNGGVNKGDITDMVIFAEADSVLNSMRPATPKQIEKINLLDTYSRHLRQLIIDGTNMGEKPLSGLKITVDAGNGSGGFYATDVLEPLGADISSSQFLEPDGMFPNHAPNPENKEAMSAIREQVLRTSPELGLIFDTDVDRSSAVDEKGHEINRNGIVAMAAALISDNYPGTTVVTDSITSPQLTEFLEKELSLKHLRFKRGYRNVINKSVELNNSGIDSQLAIETSGHAAYKENYFLDDGAYLATKIVIRTALLHKEGLGISSVIESLEEPVESAEFRFPIKAENFGEYGDRIILELSDWIKAEGSAFGAKVEEPNYEGVRVSFDKDVKGWFLLRKSLHDPIMPLNVEADTIGGVEKICNILKEFFAEYDKLDISKIK